MPRLAKARGVRSSWNYTVAEIAERASVSRNTVREWIKVGLPVVTDRRPFLIRGDDLKRFLDRRRADRKQPLAPGEIYCVACHAPQRPAGDMVDYIPQSPTRGTLIGLCPQCLREIRRAVARDALHEVAAGLELKITKHVETLARLQSALTP